MPLLRRLVDDGETGEAACIARLALRDPECAERAEVIAVLDELTNAPSAWSDALERFAKEPSIEAWREMMSFVPDEVRYQRLKYTVLLLTHFGCDGDVLFRCASESGGFMPELFDLANTGRVDPETIVARANGSPAEASWLGLAAQAAFARGDRDAVVRYLWRAWQSEPALAWASAQEILDRGDAEVNAELERLGIGKLFV